MMIETHAHIYSREFKEDLSEVIDRSRESGIASIYMPNIDHTSIDDMLEVEEKYPDYCIPTMGLHPCSVNKGFEKELYLVEEWLGKRGFVAIGEIGTDLYWDKTFQEQQIEAFKVQVGWAKQSGIPVIIHCRESFDLTVSLVEELKDDRLTGVFHCFTGSVAEAERVKNLGFYIGLGGVTTFKNAGMDKVIPELDMGHVVLETDSPYLAPVPKRGKRNEPSYLTWIAQRVADLRQTAIEDIREMTTHNAKKLFQAND